MARMKRDLILEDIMGDTGLGLMLRPLASVLLNYTGTYKYTTLSHLLAFIHAVPFD